MNRALISQEQGKKLKQQGLRLKEQGKRLKEQEILCFNLQARKIIEFCRMPST